MELKKTNHQRPWQGTALAVLSILGLIVTGMIIILLLAAGFGSDVIVERLSQISEADLGTDYGLASAGIKWIVGIMLFTILPLWIVQIFVTRGMFRGTRWTIIYSIVLTSLAILGQLPAIILPPVMLVFALNCFMLYLEIVCLQHPYYKS